MFGIEKSNSGCSFCVSLDRAIDCDHGGIVDVAQSSFKASTLCQEPKVPWADLAVKVADVVCGA